MKLIFCETIFGEHKERQFLESLAETFLNLSLLLEIDFENIYNFKYLYTMIFKLYNKQFIS